MYNSISIGLIPKWEVFLRNWLSLLLPGWIMTLIGDLSIELLKPDIAWGHWGQSALLLLMRYSSTGSKIVKLKRRDFDLNRGEHRGQRRLVIGAQVMVDGIHMWLVSIFWFGVLIYLQLRILNALIRLELVVALLEVSNSRCEVRISLRIHNGASERVTLISTSDLVDNLLWGPPIRHLKLYHSVNVGVPHAVILRCALRFWPCKRCLLLKVVLDSRWELKDRELLEDNWDPLLISLFSVLIQAL